MPLALRLLLLTAAVTAAASVMHGVVFGGDEWTAPSTQYGSASSARSLAALAATGASHVRLLTTAYQASINSTSIYAIAPPSPLASEPLEALRSAVRAAAALNLSVFIAPILDPDWDVVTNGRSITPPAGAAAVSRLQIGAGFIEAQWAAWFASYSAWLLPLARLAAEEGAAMFEVASELDVALRTRAPQWRALIAAVRAVYAGPLAVAANAGTLHEITFWDALDVIGVDAYYDLGAAALPLGVAPSVAELVAAWAPIVADLAVLSAAQGGKTVLITEVGYQSRPSCHVRPWGTVVHDPLDDSAWLEDHDLACQANAYEALFRAFAGQPWWGGVFWWLWHGDDSAGGSSDSDFTPHGKPAEVVLRRWYGGGGACPAGGAYGARFLAEGDGMAQPWLALARDGSDAECDGSAAVAEAVRRRRAAPRRARRHAPQVQRLRLWRPGSVERTFIQIRQRGRRRLARIAARGGRRRGRDHRAVVRRRHQLHGDLQHRRPRLAAAHLDRR